MCLVDIGDWWHFWEVGIGGMDGSGFEETADE